MNTVPLEGNDWLFFYNTEPIRIEAFTVHGLNVKPKPGAFGTFGTGLKHAMAWLAASGAEVHIFSSGLAMPQLQIGVKEQEFRGETVKRVALFSGQTTIQLLPFTTNLAKNWQPWMILRELRCNALDEVGGGFCTSLADVPPEAGTIFAIRSPALSEVYARSSEFFIEPTAVQDSGTESFQLFRKPAHFLFYRGVAVYQLPKQSRFTYNFLQPMQLTEDRTLAYIHQAHIAITTQITQSTDEDFLDLWHNSMSEALERSTNWWENDLDFDYIMGKSPSGAALRYIMAEKLTHPEKLLPWYRGSETYINAERPTEFAPDDQRQLSTALTRINAVFPIPEDIRFEPSSPLRAAHFFLDTSDGKTRLCLLHPQLFLLSPDQFLGALFYHLSSLLNANDVESTEHRYWLGRQAFAAAEAVAEKRAVPDD